MKQKPDIERLIAASMYGEATLEEQARLEQLMQENPGIREQYHQLLNTADMISGELQPADPGEEFWDSTWSNFRDVLLEEKQNEEMVHESIWHQFWKPALQIGFVASMLVLGVFIGKQLTIMPQEQQIAEEPAEESPPPLNTREIDSSILEQKNSYMRNVTSSSLQKSTQVLDSFMEIRPERLRTGNYQFFQDAQMREIDQLMETLSVLRNNQELSGSRELEPLIADLELLLGEIASIRNVRGEDLTFEVHNLQQGIRRLNLQERIQTVSQR